ncbi:MAG TPA: DinB family protein [Terriglobales bacterium]|nr:DinB family protein [Terriglobales bacterium]
MKVLVSCVCLFFMASVAVAQQSSNPVTDAVKMIMQRSAKNLPAAVEEMPADKFSFKPTPQQEPFAHIAVHVTQSNNMLCSRLGSEPAPAKQELSDTTPKDQLVSAMKASFDYCGKALGAFSDSHLGDEAELFGGHKGTKAAALFFLVSGWSDHYAQAAMYLRQAGLLPPTAKKEK